MTTHIEFAPTGDKPQSKTAASPWDLPKSKTYEDLILKEEYTERVLRFKPGQTWFRIVPALKGSLFPWMLPLHALCFQGGRFAHPRSLKAGAQSVYDRAYRYLKSHAPQGLYSRENKNGIRLLTDPVSLFWVLVEEDGKFHSRLVLANGYNGNRGGTVGLGGKIWQACQTRDERGELSEDALNAERGVLICVDRSEKKGSEYAGYTVRLGRQPRPIAEIIASMEPTEISALTPLENTVRELTEDEQWECLAKVIAPATVEQIRTADRD